jgi:hypothetical protein
MINILQRPRRSLVLLQDKVMLFDIFQMAISNYCSLMAQLLIRIVEEAFGQQLIPRVSSVSENLETTRSMMSKEDID